MTRDRSFRILLAIGLLSAAIAVSCTSSSNNPETAAAAPAVAQEKGGQEETGPYEPVPDWPKPLADAASGALAGALQAAKPTDTATIAVKTNMNDHFRARIVSPP